MFILGITGGIGSGKTIVSKALETLGAKVYNADLKSKALLETNLEIKTKLRQIFGSAILQKDGKINKPALAAVVFENPEKLKLLNSFVHPAVEKDFNIWKINQKEAPYLVFEAAILIESGFGNKMDMLVQITAPEEIRIARVCKRDSTKPEQVKLRIQNQLSDDERAKMCHLSLINDGKVLLLPQILSLHKNILQRIT